MNINQNKIGFSSQVMRYEWLKQTSLWFLAGMELEDIQSELKSYISRWLSDEATSGSSSCIKATRILLNTWVTPDHRLIELRDDGARLLKELPDDYKIAVHWGMIMAAYPFWGKVAESVGRLIKLQGSLRMTQVHRRLKEQYGDREIVARATRTVIRSFVDWEVLEESDNKGGYIIGKYITIKDPSLIAWMIESFMHARENGAFVIKDILTSPSLFPFNLAHVSAEQVGALSPRMDVLKHDLDNDLVVFRKR